MGDRFHLVRVMLTSLASTAVSTSTGWKSWDTNSLVSAWLNGTYASYGVGVTGPVAGSLWQRQFSSRQGSVVPQLVVTYVVPTPTPTVTPTRTPTPTRTLTPTSTPTPTPTLGPTCPDAFEPNDTLCPGHAACTRRSRRLPRLHLLACR